MSASSQSAETQPVPQRHGKVTRVICIHCGLVYDYPNFDENSYTCYCLAPGCDGGPLDVWRVKRAMRQNGKTEQELAEYFGGHVCAVGEKPVLVGRSNPDAQSTSRPEAKA